jgi:hypothetical protein
MLNKSVIAIVAVLAFGTPALAQSGSVEEIVVTGSRVREWDPDQIPAVRLNRRADNLIVEIRAVGDTRDAAQRRAELVETLRGLARSAAHQADIDLSIEVDGALTPLTEDMVSTLTLGVDGNRSDTSTASLIVKTPIRPDDTMDAASGRIERFVQGAPKSGRTLLNITGDWQLSILNPTQYREPILTLMAEDARTTARTFGAEYGVQAEGLENRVTWIQSGPLELSLFIPYKLAVTPKT